MWKIFSFSLDMSRSKNRDAPSNMKLFPEDVARAEVLTGGNPNILHNEMFQPEEKPSYTDLFSSTKKTPKKIKSEGKKKTAQPLTTSQTTPRIITHPRFLKLSSGFETDYEARERKQEPLRAECDEEDNSPPTTYRCPDCDFTTIRLNVIVLHNKSHTRNYGTPVPMKTIKRKSTSLKFKERMSNEWKANDIEPVKAKIPKTNGTFGKKTPKTPGRRRAIIEKESSRNITEELEKKSEISPEKSKKSTFQTDEFQESLLEDWAEYEMGDQEALEKDTSSQENIHIENNTENTSSENTKSVEKKTTTVEEDNKKSCFDFDDSEDHIVIDKSKIKFGRKIPRVLEEKVEDTRNLQSDILEMRSVLKEEEISNSYVKGLDERYFSDSPKQNQLQEIGVDNEIEINTEVGSEDVTELLDNSIEKSHSTDSETVMKERDAAELSEKVNQLLDEISTPSKLPTIPRLHKKDRLKEYCESVKNTTDQSDEKMCIVLEHNQEIGAIAEVKQDLDIMSSLNDKTSDVVNESDMSIKQDKCSESVTDIVLSPKSIVPIQDTVECEVEALQPEIQQKDVSQSQDDDISSKVIEINAPEYECEKTAVKEPNIISVTVSNTINRIQTTPLKLIEKRPPIRFHMTSQLKTINASQVFNTTPKNVKVVPKVLISSNTPAPHSPGKTRPTMTLKTTDGQSITCSLKPGMLRHRTPTTATSTQSQQIGNISLTGSKVHLSPNMLQKTAKSTAAGRPQKTVVLSPSTLQMLMQQSSNKSTVLQTMAPVEADVTVKQAQPELVYVPDGKSFEMSNTDSSNQNLELNYIVDRSGNLISLPSTENSSANVSRKEDILAKALENTDVLQTEMTLDASPIVIDSHTAAQNTSSLYKTESLYENVTLNTPPIMSAYETPSRINSTSIADIPNEMIIIGGNDTVEYSLGSST